MLIWDQILSHFAVGTISVLAVFGFFGKSITSLFTKRNIEQLKSELSLLEAKSRQRFSKYFDIQFERLLELYDCVVFSEAKIRILSGQEVNSGNIDEILKAALSSYLELREKSRASTPFISATLAASLKAFENEFDSELRHYSNSKKLTEAKVGFGKCADLLENAAHAIAKEIREL